MLTEIGDYEELSSNMDSADDWQGDAGEAASWLEDLWRVSGESELREAQGGAFDDDRILAAAAPAFSSGSSSTERFTRTNSAHENRLSARKIINKPCSLSGASVRSAFLRST